MTTRKQPNKIKKFSFAIGSTILEEFSLLDTITVERHLQVNPPDKGRHTKIQMKKLPPTDDIEQAPLMAEWIKTINL